MTYRVRHIDGSWDRQLDMPVLTGRVALVTGATGGIGREVAKALIGAKAKVILATRNDLKTEELLAELRSEFPSGDFYRVPLDLADLDSVFACAEQVLASEERLDILVNNAGVWTSENRNTADGFELHMGTNFLGHFALTAKLMPLIEKTISARIVMLGSLIHSVPGTLDFDDFFSQKKFNGDQAYARSKLACIMFAYWLDRQFQERKVAASVIAAHPGVSGTELVTGRFGALGGLLKAPLRATLNKSKDSAVPLIRAAVDSSLLGGSYLGPDGWKEVKGDSAIIVESNDYSYDQEAQDQLVEIATQLTGTTIDPQRPDYFSESD